METTIETPREATSSSPDDRHTDDHRRDDRPTEAEIARLDQEIAQESSTLRQVEDEIRKVIVGQDYLLDRLLVGLLARGHVLLEGVPGLAKTLAVKTLAGTLQIDFQRIQFTPDLLPADLVGTLIWDQRTREFIARRGPVFTHLLLADEINRAPAKVQSALLEAMEEKQVTLGDTTSLLEEPFMVLATQNPIEQEGTYPLAEAQVDRFMLKLKLDYPSREEERRILDRMLVEREIPIESVVDRERLLELRKVADRVYLDRRIREYILDLVAATRTPREAGLGDLAELVAFGASPRATLFLARAAKALALVRGRGFVLPEDVKAVAPDVLRHRVIPTYEAEAEEITADDLVGRVLERVEVP